MILAIINMMLDFQQFNRAKDSSTAENAVMAIISGLIWPFMIVMNIVFIFRAIYLKRFALKQIKTVIVSLCKDKSIDVNRNMLRLKAKRKSDGTHTIVGCNSYTKELLKDLKVEDITFNLYAN